MNRIVCAHELGHDQLHREFAASNTLQEFMLYDMNSIQEYEANVFAANLLLEDEAVLELVYDGYDIVRIAAELQSDVNLVAPLISITPFLCSASRIALRSFFSAHMRTRCMDTTAINTTPPFP